MDDFSSIPERFGIFPDFLFFFRNSRWVTSLHFNEVCNDAEPLLTVYLDNQEMVVTSYHSIPVAALLRVVSAGITPYFAPYAALGFLNPSTCMQLAPLALNSVQSCLSSIHTGLKDFSWHIICDHTLYEGTQQGIFSSHIFHSIILNAFRALTTQTHSVTISSSTSESKNWELGI